MLLLLFKIAAKVDARGLWGRLSHVCGEEGGGTDNELQRDLGGKGGEGGMQQLVQFRTPRLDKLSVISRSATPLTCA